MKQETSQEGARESLLSKDEPTGEASAMTTAANIIKATLGAGILFLPKCFGAAGWTIGTFWFIYAGFFNSLSMYILGAACRTFKENSFMGGMRAAAGKENAALVTRVVTACLLTYVFFIAVCYGCAIGKLALNIFHVIGADLWYEENTMATILVCFLSPLMIGVSMFKETSKLWVTSYLGIGAIVTSFVLMLVRGCTHIFSGADVSIHSPNAVMTYAPVGSWPAGVGASAQFWNVMGLVGFLGAGLSGHYGGPSIFGGMKDKSKWMTASVSAMGCILAILGTFCALAVKTFGYHNSQKGIVLELFTTSQEHIDNNPVYRTAGFFAIFLMTLSLFGSFPLVINTCRSCVYEILEGPYFMGIQAATKDGSGWNHTTTRRAILTTAISCVVLLISFIFNYLGKEPGMPLDIAQFLVGNLFSYVFPAYMYYKSKKEHSMLVKILLVMLVISGIGFSIVSAVLFVRENFLSLA